MDFRFWIALVGALPELIALFSRMASWAQSAKDRGIGYNQAVKDAVSASAAGLAVGMEAVNEAREKHKADPTDDAFDKTFMRTD